MKTENWKLKVILFYIVCAIIIGYPFFTIKYFESHTALKITAKYLLGPIIICLLVILPRFYLKKVKPIDKIKRSKIKEKFSDFFSILFMLICSTGIFFGVAFSLIITTNKSFGKSEIVMISQPVEKYTKDNTKNGRLRH
jgi:amino acid permease